ncbi:uncharacterized protein A4U43_C05F6390 [Asparagus officinalis]|uniref:Pentacotripeptide-repeat region of PRORP domain-containing protein n=1 Tax=Asparagus officinalis TaxID=4686 RepID=A0A5P1EQE3_ASPOF|nr:pentatricopeptide repeat-containing protein At1g73400, mitochondrial [Asparagus officinalis]ONK68024.1 uncharacterized protein A4U43_C05F6390 [Asparagus officinalis]
MWRFPKFCRNLVLFLPTSPVSSNLVPLIRPFSSPSKEIFVSGPPILEKLQFSRFCTLSSHKDLILDQPVSENNDQLISAADRVYEAIISNSNSNKSLEATLDSLGLELSTELVDDVIRKLRYEERLALRFFTWAGHHHDYAHERQTYNYMIDILSSTRYKLKQFGVLCDVLDQMKRKNNHSVSVEALMIILKNYTEKHLTHVRRFAKKKKIKITAPEVDAFNMLLDSLCKCSLAREAEVLFHRVKKRVSPNADTYNILFFGWCRVRDPKKAMEVLEEMIGMGFAPENFTYNAAIDSFCSVGMVSEARELFEFMRTKGSTISSPTAKTYSVMIVALAKDDQMDECFSLLGDMRNTGCLPDVSTYKDLIEGMCLIGKIDAAYKILEEMGNKGYPPDVLTYNCFLKVLCNLKKPEEALMLCEKMIEVGCEPSVHTYNMLISMFFEMKESERAVGIWHEMDRRKCARTADTYSIMVEGLFDCERVDDACSLLDEVIERGMKLPFVKFDALMRRLSEIGNLQAIHRLSDHMRRFYNVAMARRFAISQKKKSMSLRGR